MNYNYTGPAVPIADWVGDTVNGDGSGFIRLVEAPAVKPAMKKPTNSINVISSSYVPHGMNIHYQTAFGLGTVPSVKWGTDPGNLNKMAYGSSQTYVNKMPLKSS